ncbi:MAG: DUF4388 domain-containing protein [Dehalococcoidia bacterium]
MREGLNGSLAQWPLADVLSMLSSASQTGRIALSDGTRRADIFVEGGAIVHAATPDEAGRSALVAIMTWPTGNFSFEPRVPAPDKTILLATAELLEICKDEAEERVTIMKVIPSPSAAPHLTRARPRDDITLSPAEWQLMTHVDGRTSVVELAQALNMEEYAFARLLHRLCEEGLVTFAADAAAVAALVPQPSAPVVNQAFFTELTRATATAMGPMAPVVIDDALAALGESEQAFPKDKVSRLVELVANDIREDVRRAGFQQAMIKWLRAQAA